MTKNAKKFSDKMSKTSQFHLLAVAGFGLGIFFPVPALITFANCVAIAGMYEIAAINKDMDKRETVSGATKSSFNSLCSKVSTLYNAAKTDSGMQSQEQAVINEGVNMFSSLADRHVAMLSVFTGFTLGIGLGMIAAVFSPALAIVVGASVIGPAAIAITYALYMKDFNNGLAKVHPEQGSYQTSAKFLAGRSTSPTSVVPGDESTPQNNSFLKWLA
jgi:hypothetical protein